MDCRSLYGLASTQCHLIQGWENFLSTSHGSDASFKEDFLNSYVNFPPYCILSKHPDPFSFVRLTTVCRKEWLVKCLATGATWTLTDQNGHKVQKIGQCQWGWAEGHPCVCMCVCVWGGCSVKADTVSIGYSLYPGPVK